MVEQSFSCFFAKFTNDFFGFFLQEPMDESATKIPEVLIAAKQCVANADGKLFRLKSRNDVNASFIGVAMWSVKLVQEMSNLQSVNK